MNDLSEFKLPAAAASDEGWCVYLLLCRGGALYCGISNRPDERFAAHCAGRGAKFTRMHKPQEMRLLYAAISRSEAAHSRRFCSGASFFTKGSMRADKGSKPQFAAPLVKRPSETFPGSRFLM